jgi:hypothetical protein
MTDIEQILGDLNKDSFVSLLKNIIGESKYVQNNPPELIPEEDRVVTHVLNSLLPYSTTTRGGPLIVNHVSCFPKRGNLIVEYPGTEPGKILSFVGMHMDVVTANPNDWVCSFLSFFFSCLLKWGLFDFELVMRLLQFPHEVVAEFYLGSHVYVVWLRFQLHSNLHFSV